MSIHTVTERYEGRRQTWQVEKAQREYTRVFQVVTTSPTDDLTVVANAVDPITSVAIPNWTPGGTPPSYPNDSGALLKRKECTVEDSHYTCFNVILSYDSCMPDPTQQKESPLDRPPCWNFGGRTVEKPITEDVYGNPILNSACCPIEGVNQPYTILTFDAQVNVASLSLSLLLTYKDSINSVAWTPLSAANFTGTFPKRTVRIANITTQQKWENATVFWELKVAGEIEPDGWSPTSLLDTGLYKRKCSSSSSSTSSGSLMPGDVGDTADCGCDVATLDLIRDKKGQPISTPHLLCNGVPSTTPCYLDFWTYNEVDFSGLPL